LILCFPALAEGETTESSEDTASILRPIDRANFF